MNRSDFYYPLPESLIARYPLAERSSSRLLKLDRDSGSVSHARFYQLPDLLRDGDLLVLNNTKVIPARIYGAKTTGGRVEMLFERILTQTTALAHVGANKPPKAGTVIEVPGGQRFEIIERRDDLYLIEAQTGTIRDILHEYGEMPLPPYIDREAQPEDRERYQTRYAQYEGAVAAPTAGLHFDEGVFDRLKRNGIGTGYLTLHVGAGTFQPVRADDIREHRMHEEYLEIPESLCEQIRKTRQKGGRIIAVGTTCVRALESAASSDGSVTPVTGDTDIFIYPGYDFKAIDGMITNFHLPESTLIMLVCAFGGYNAVMDAYREAVERQYRFYSYGDAMLIL